MVFVAKDTIESKIAVFVAKLVVKWGLIICFRQFYDLTIFLFFLIPLKKKINFFWSKLAFFKKLYIIGDIYVLYFIFSMLEIAYEDRIV